MVLQFYCNLRYGTAFEGQTLETDPAYDIEDILAKYPESQVANDMQRPVVQTFEETPTCCRVRLEKAGLVTYTHGTYQKAADVLGFFGYSVARPEVLKRRMDALTK